MANPNSLKNLKPFQKGNPGGPGRPRAVLTRAQVEVLFQRFSTKTRDQLQAVIVDHKSTMLEIMIATVMIKAAKDGDAMRLQFLLDRAVGKVATVNENEDDRLFREERERLQQLSDNEVIKLVKEKMLELEAPKSEKEKTEN